MTKPQIQRILFATDFLESSRLALDYAVAVAHHFQATIVMLHAVALPPAAHEAEATTHLPSVSRDEAEAYLRGFAKGVQRTGITVETRVVDGEPSKAILAAVAEDRIDLLVLGVHGVHRGLSHLLIGSNAEKILLSATCPTLTVGAHVRAGIDVALPVRQVVYLSDFTEQAAAAVPYAHFLASTFAAPLETYHLIRDDALEDDSEELRSLLPDADPNWLQPQCQLQRGLKLKDLLLRARSQTHGLIVTGVQRASSLDRHFQTSFAYQLIATATCPVVTVNPEKP